MMKEGLLLFEISDNRSFSECHASYRRKTGGFGGGGSALPKERRDEDEEGKGPPVEAAALAPTTGKALGGLGKNVHFFYIGFSGADRVHGEEEAG